MKKNHLTNLSVTRLYKFKNISSKWKFYAKVKILTYTLIALIFFGCNSVQPQTKQQSSVKKVDIQKPLWIENPFIDGYIVGVGSSNHKNLMLKKKIALASARANLAQAIKVETKISTKITISSNSSSENIEQIIEEKAKELLVGSEIEDTFQDSDGTYYIMVILNKNATSQ